MYKRQGCRAHRKALCPGGVDHVRVDHQQYRHTLRKALAYSDGPQLAGGARTLLRQATAGLLNRARYTDGYPPFGYTTKDLLAGVNSALGTQLRSKYLAVASMLAGWNNGVA